MNLQDNFLNLARKENVPVTIYLISGVQLKGVVRGFDAFTVVLESPGKPAQLVYKHAIASIVPSRPVMGVMPREERPAQPAQEEKPAQPAREEVPDKVEEKVDEKGEEKGEEKEQEKAEE